jgi:hypothetical protein
MTKKLTTQWLYNFFDKRNIYIGSYDCSKHWDEETDTVVVDGYRLGFSNHDGMLYLPLDVLITLQNEFPDYHIRLEQTGFDAINKPMYLYLRIFK